MISSRFPAVTVSTLIAGVTIAIAATEQIGQTWESCAGALGNAQQCN